MIRLWPSHIANDWETCGTLGMREPVANGRLFSGVAVGSSIGHAIGGMFGGGGSSEPAQASPQATQQPQNDQWGPNCSLATKSFTNCMDEHQGNMSICGWYMEQLKACQAAASQY